VVEILDFQPTRQPYLIRQGVTRMVLCALSEGDTVWMLPDELFIVK
jgi:hypothetical protein